jgi:hypothetical protein
MGCWAKSLQIFTFLCGNDKPSGRDMAQQTGDATSSVHRLEQAIERRHCPPESGLWETEAGRRGVIRLVVATLYPFGLKRGVGAETLSEFFCRLRLDTHVGCSPRALRSGMQRLDDVSVEIGQRWQEAGIRGGEARPVIGAVDEPCCERLRLGVMDLVSGSLLFEEIAADRT